MYFLESMFPHTFMSIDGDCRICAIEKSRLNRDAYGQETDAIQASLHGAQCVRVRLAQTCIYSIFGEHLSWSDKHASSSIEVFERNP